MGIFSFFKKRSPATSQPPRVLEPSNILKQTLEEIPPFFHNNIHFKAAADFLQHSEWGLALTSFIEMAAERGHYFSEEFWIDLAICADSMNMKNEAVYCREQILRNEKTIGIKIHRGTTWFEKADGLFEQHTVATTEHKEWVNERRKKDKLEKLIKKDGFHMKPQGRWGIIYHIDNGKVLELDWEISGVPQYDILLEFETLHSWSIPDGIPIMLEEELTIRRKLLDWLNKKKIRSDLRPARFQYPNT
jgi:uncharacterized protein YbaR (Trm112 family)